jgi:hypothetical protein
MPRLVPGIHVFKAFAARKTWMAGTIGERSDAVLRTAMASEATPFFEQLCATMTKSGGGDAPTLPDLVESSLDQRL